MALKIDMVIKIYFIINYKNDIKNTLYQKNIKIFQKC